MSTSRLQELLAEQNLSLQELSDRSGLSIDTIQAIEPQVQGVFANLQKIAQSLNTTAPKLFELFSTPKESDRPEGHPEGSPFGSTSGGTGLTSVDNKGRECKPGDRSC